MSGLIVITAAVVIVAMLELADMAIDKFKKRKK